MSGGIKIAYGAAGIGNNDNFKTEEQLNELFSVLEKYDVKILDSAQLYGESEKVLGEVKAGQRFTIDTKWLGGWQGKAWASKENIINTAHESIKKLGVQKVSRFKYKTSTHGVDKLDKGRYLLYAQP